MYHKKNGTGVMYKGGSTFQLRMTGVMALQDVKIVTPIKYSISYLYKLKYVFTLGLIDKWEKNTSTKFSTTFNKYQKPGNKIITQWYWTLIVLNSMYSSVSDFCWRCVAFPGDILQIY